MDRRHFSTVDSLTHLWTTLGLPPKALGSVRLPDADALGLPSSFKIGNLAQSSIALTALLAALIHTSQRHRGAENGNDGDDDEDNDTAVPTVTVPLHHAVVEFRSERFHTIAGSHPGGGRPHSAVGGLHRTSDGWVRVHDIFPHHRARALEVLGCSADADREAVAAAIGRWRCVDLENTALEAGAVVAALRSYEQWDVLPHAKAIRDFPIQIREIGSDDDGLAAGRGDGSLGGWQERKSQQNSGDNSSAKALHGVRVLEMSRVIAAPVAGRTLAAHGADVLWVTSPGLPDLPVIDRDTARGKRTASLDLDLDTDAKADNPSHASARARGNHESDSASDKEILLSLADDADVFLQGYRPGSLAGRGLSIDALIARRRQKGIRRGIVCANLSAYGADGPWRARRGFDSLVQTCSGMNVSEAEHFSSARDDAGSTDGSAAPHNAGGVGTSGAGSAARPMPCQALDHASGYFLAAGIMAALYRQSQPGCSGYSYEVSVSLAGTMKYLRSLGQYPGNTGFQCDDYATMQDVPAEYLEERMSGFGLLKAVKHSATIDGVPVGWDIMPNPLGSDEPRWL
ncbi:hypothetical protein AYO21_10104 [Fonsecaea monophora]|uniref:CoA-transferase family III n=1 Tax=Fonsecaea monophora TaxID=254056 RepID=A0A177EWQ3_9EURO|nr:hypothetical protein AYO21_10104 [Fonsecaea monophora]KAH0846115.1 CAIB/BAIF family enzyme [Fonsecaea pedrosoi]OAG35710.1 hypothetical protein AYO21_10104 [Fonsecaea monophora]